MQQNPLDVQVGGNHYANKAVQPIEFGMANRLDDCAFSVLKYVSRHAEKNGRQDLEKASHFVELRSVLATEQHMIRDWVMSMDDYCRANGLPEEESAALQFLSDWVETHNPLYLRRLRHSLAALIDLRYSTDH